MRLLRNLIPGGGEHGRRGDGEAHTPTEIAAWHEGHRTMSRVDLAFEYLQLGSMGQQLISLDIILGGWRRCAEACRRYPAPHRKETNPEDSGFYSITSLASTFVARLEPTEATAFLERFSAAQGRLRGSRRRTVFLVIQSADPRPITAAKCSMRR